MEPLRLFTELTLDKCDIFCSFALIYSDKLLISSLSVRNSNGNLNLLFHPCNECKSEKLKSDNLISQIFSKYLKHEMADVTGGRLELVKAV